MSKASESTVSWVPVVSQVLLSLIAPRPHLLTHASDLLDSWHERRVGEQHAR